MLLDTHVHLLASKVSRPDWSEINHTFNVAKIKGIDLLCITEHIDAEGFEELYREIFIENRLGGDYESSGMLRLKSGIVISPGAEVSLAGGGDMGVHTGLNTIMSLDSRKGTYSAEILLDVLEAGSNDYVAVAHHVLIEGKWWKDFDQVVDRLDAIEVPGKHSCCSDDYLALADRYSKGKLCGSDAHNWVQLGAGLTFVECGAVDGGSEYSLNISGLKHSLLNNKTIARLNATADAMVSIAKLYTAQKTGYLVER
ncbi:PHP domain-containing protein [Pseudomonas sp. LB3P31]